MLKKFFLRIIKLQLAQPIAQRLRCISQMRRRESDVLWGGGSTERKGGMYGKTKEMAHEKNPVRHTLQRDGRDERDRAGHGGVCGADG